MVFVVHLGMVSYTAISNNQVNMTLQNTEPHDPYAALRYRDFRLLLTGRFLTAFGNEMLTFAIGWELWLRTHEPFVLGMVGLVQVIPVILLSLPAGHVADQYNRKRIVLISELFLALCVLGLGWLSYTQGPLYWIYALLLGIGIARAFNDPASSTLLPQTVPPPIFANAATWSTSTWQFASITGPALAGLLIGFFNSVTFVYIFDALAAIVFCILLLLIRGRQLALAQKAARITFVSRMNRNPSFSDSHVAAFWASASCLPLIRSRRMQKTIAARASKI